MRDFVRSEGYARARLVSAALFVACGAVLAFRTLVAAPPSFAMVPALVLAAAFVALGGLRIRDYLAVRRRRP